MIKNNLFFLWFRLLFRKLLSNILQNLFLWLLCRVRVYAGDKPPLVGFSRIRCVRLTPGEFTSTNKKLKITFSVVFDSFYVVKKPWPTAFVWMLQTESQGLFKASGPGRYLSKTLQCVSDLKHERSCLSLLQNVDTLQQKLHKETDREGVKKSTWQASLFPKLGLVNLQSHVEVIWGEEMRVQKESNTDCIFKLTHKETCDGLNSWSAL